MSCPKRRGFLLFGDSVILRRMWAPCLLSPSSSSGHLGCLRVLAAVGDAAVSTGCSYPFEMVISFPSHIDPETGAPSFHPFTSSPALVVSCLLDTSRPDRRAGIAVVLLICVSLMMNDVEHLSMCPLAITMSSWEKCRLRSSAHVSIRFHFCP